MDSKQDNKYACQYGWYVITALGVILSLFMVYKYFERQLNLNKEQDDNYVSLIGKSRDSMIIRPQSMVSQSSRQSNFFKHLDVVDVMRDDELVEDKLSNLKIDSTMETHEINLNVRNDRSSFNRESDFQINEMYKIAGSDIESQKRFSIKKLEVDTILIEIDEDENDGNTPLNKCTEDVDIYEELDIDEEESTNEQKRQVEQQNEINIVQLAQQRQSTTGDYDVETLSDGDFKDTIEITKDDQLLKDQDVKMVQEKDDSQRVSYMNQVMYEIKNDTNQTKDSNQTKLKLVKNYSHPSPKKQKSLKSIQPNAKPPKQLQKKDQSKTPRVKQSKKENSIKTKRSKKPIKTGGFQEETNINTPKEQKIKKALIPNMNSDLQPQEMRQEQPKYINQDIAEPTELDLALQKVKKQMVNNYLNEQRNKIKNAAQIDIPQQ